MAENDSISDRLDADGVACSLTEEAARRRRERVTDELFPHLDAVEKRDDGVSFTFEGTDEAVAAVMEFVRLEHRCCSFARFDLRLAPGGEPVRLDVTGEGSNAMFERGLQPLLEDYDPSLVDG